MDKEIKNLKKEILTREEVVKLKERVIEVEDRSRRNNLRITGIKDDQRETWRECEKKVEDLFKNVLEVDVDIERVHRIRKVKEAKPRTIVLKLLNWKDNEKVMGQAKKLKGKNIYINEDFSLETTELRKNLWEQVKQYRKEGKYAVLNYKSVVVRDRKI